MFFDKEGRFGTSHLFPSDKAFVLPLMQRSFFAEFQLLLNSWVFSVLEGRHLLVRPQAMNVSWADLLDLPVHDAPTAEADYAQVSQISAEPGHSADFDRMRGTLLRYAARPVVKIPQVGLKMPLEKLMARASQAAFRPKADVHEEAARRMADFGLLCDFYAIHIRGDEQTPMARYMDPILADSAEPRVFVLTDDYRRVTELRVNYPEADFATLCSFENEGFSESRFAALDQDRRTAEVRALFVEVAIANCAKAFYGPYLSNVSQFIHQLRYPRASFSVDSATQWTPVRTQPQVQVA